MLVNIREIGTSKGIIIPAVLLKEYNITDEVNLEPAEGGIIITPVRQNPRQGWAEHAKQVSMSEVESQLRIPDVFEDEDFSDWVWENE